MAYARGWPLAARRRSFKQLRLWEEIGVDRMVFIINTAEVIPQERVLKSLRLFAEHVMPVLDHGAGKARKSTSAGSLAEATMP